MSLMMKVYIRLPVLIMILLANLHQQAKGCGFSRFNVAQRLDLCEYSVRHLIRSIF